VNSGKLRAMVTAGFTATSASPKRSLIIRFAAGAEMNSGPQMQLVRLGIWSGVFDIAVLMAVVAANTEPRGLRRLASLVSPDAGVRGRKALIATAPRSFYADRKQGA